jgi:hypothetical protein
MEQNSFKPKRPNFMDNFAQQLNGAAPSQSVQNYAVGNRTYNGGLPSPHAGGGLDKGGYAERDMKALSARNNALINYLRSKGVR